jgi:3-methyladenine DNA glycosylase AlkD
MTDAERLAEEIAGKLRRVPGQGTPLLRTIGLEYSRTLRRADAGFVTEVAQRLTGPGGCRFVAYEILVRHKGAFQSLTPARILSLGEGISGWSMVDCFGFILAGPAWRDGHLSSEIVRGWAMSEDRWWRRAALVSTIALSRGGRAVETIGICSLLAADTDDMVVKALSWALRELAKKHPDKARSFLAEHDEVLAARVKREVRNKLTSGLARPKKHARSLRPD